MNSNGFIIMKDQANLSRTRIPGKNREKEYWLKRLSGELVKSRFPFETDRRLAGQGGMADVPIEFDGELVERMLKLARNSEVMLHMVLAAGLAVCLNKHSGHRDIIIGSPIYRQEEEGPFINTVLVLRNHLDDKMTFKDLLLQVRQTVVEATQHQNYPLETLLYQLNLPPSSGNDFPLFDIVVLLDNIHDRRHILHTHPNMIFSFHKGDSDLKGRLEYSASRYENSAVETIIGHLKTIFLQALSDIEMSLAEITILSGAEKQRILCDLNDTSSAYPREKTVSELFDEQVLRAPGRVAIAFSDWQETFRDLDIRAEGLGNQLQQCSVGPNVMVGLMIQRSPEMILALLGIIKAGGAYLPMDPRLPTERVRCILSDSRSHILITSAEIIRNQNFSQLRDISLLLMLDIFDESNFHDVRGPVWRPGPVNRAEDLIYCIYTSGSSGKPRGVLVEHRNVHNLVLGLAERIYSRYDVKLRLALISPIWFDASVKQVFAALLLGHCLCMISETGLENAQSILDFYARHRIDVSDGTPTLLRLLREGASEMNDCLPVRHLLIGGEALHRDSLRRFLGSFPGDTPIVTNVYGLSECGVDSSFYDVTGENPHERGTVPIGRPLPNQQIFILDGSGRLQSPGLAGEICIAGDNVSRGYLAEPELTCRKFVWHPTLRRRLFKTGDLGRYFPDGNIECLGRLDHQVKIRGNRIELGEIENRLLAYPSITDAVVVARQDGDGDIGLYAYIVADNGREDAAVGEDEIKAFLAPFLPDYMIPATYTQLAALPLNPNGKVARQALPIVQSIHRHVYSIPGNPVEKKLADIWEQVLGQESGTAGIDDNFFDCGGHSLKAIILISRIHQQLHVSVPLAQIFRTPTIRELAKFIGTVSTVNYAPVEGTEDKEYYLLSSAQKRIYLLQQLAPRGTAYNKPYAMILEGRLDLEPLEDAFAVLIRRHESLRTGVLLLNGEPFQKIQRELKFQIETEESPEGEVGNIVQRFIRPFDLDRLPLLRVKVVKRGIDRHLLLADFHHITSDGISMGIFVRELMDLLAGRELLPLPLQYRDFSEWQNRQLESPAMKEQEEYWLAKLNGEIPVLHLPIEDSRSPLPEVSGATSGFVLDPETAAALKRMADSRGCSLYMVLLALFTTWLARISGQHDILVGTPVAGRRHADLEAIIGMFVNTVVLRNFPHHELSYGQFLENVKTEVLASFENQDFQFEDLVEKVKVRKDLSRHPLFDVMLIWQNFEVPTIEIPGLKLRPLAFESRTAKFDLSLYAAEADEGLALTFEYRTRLFSSATIANFIGYFKRIVSCVLDEPGVKIGDIEIISPEEKTRILHVFNDTRIGYPDDVTIHRLFENRVSRYRDNTALSYLDQGLTFREFNDRSDSLARHLRSIGVGPAGLVGIVARRSLEMMIGIMAILKAGAAYLPIGSGYPAGRVRYMLNDGDVEIVLSRGKWIETAAAATGDFHFIDLDDGRNYGPAAADLESRTAPHDPAYVIYTSGSTGKPKGVLVKHQSLVNRINWMQRRFPLDLLSLILQKTPLTFDVSVWELFWWYWAGGRLCLLAWEAERDPRSLTDAIERYGVTVLHFVPSMFALMLDYIRTSQRVKSLWSLSYIFSSGEALTTDQAAAFHALFDNPGGVQLINLYGPTEATVDVSYFVCPGETDFFRIPIGKPIDNTELLALDRHQYMQPVGIEGELCIRGVGVALGYLNRPELTAEKFIPAPNINGTNSDPVYRTGDVVRFLADGNIDFIGRIDQQVKVRGVRIEPAEIRNRLLDHDGIKDAVIVPVDDGDGNKSLCAYLVPLSGSDEAGPRFPVSRMREFLATELPEPLIPSYFIEIPEVPLTANGKIDMNALPQPNESRPHLQATFVKPGSDMEKLIGEIWMKVLRLDRVGVYDNFFDLGGHSFDIIKVAAGLTEVLNREIPVLTLFKYPTISALGNYLAADENSGSGQEQDNDGGQTGTLDRMKESLESAVQMFDSL